MAVDETRGSLRVTHTSRTAAHVTEVLGIAPDHTFEIGDRISQRLPGLRQHSHWSLDSRVPSAGEDLGSHLRDLLDQLTTKHDAVHELAAAGYNLTWACFISAEGGQGGLVLDSELVRDMGCLPIEIWLDIYARTTEKLTWPFGRLAEFVRRVQDRRAIARWTEQH